MKNRKYGWKPDLPDHRDHLYSLPQKSYATLPQKTDLRPGCPPVYDQLATSSCTGNAISACIEYDLKRQSLPDLTPSRLFIYYNERAQEGTTSEDCGASIRDGIKTVASLGVCDEKMWPFDLDKITTKPPKNAYVAAKLHLSTKYQRIGRSIVMMRGCLAQGFPFAAGISVYESFESEDVARTGQVPMPGVDERLLGGHAVAVVGYDDMRAMFIVRNSWGTGWGMAGYFEIPYMYLVNQDLSDDFWAIQLVK